MDEDGCDREKEVNKRRGAVRRIPRQRRPVYDHDTQTEKTKTTTTTTQTEKTMTTHDMVS